MKILHIVLKTLDTSSVIVTFLSLHAGKAFSVNKYALCIFSAVSFGDTFFDCCVKATDISKM